MTKYVHSATLKEGSEFQKFVAQNPRSTVLNVDIEGAHRPTVKVENEESKPAASSVQDQGPKSEPVDDLKAAIPDTNVDIDIRRECSESKPPPKSEGEIIATCESDPNDIKILVKKDETDVLEIDPGHIDEPFSSGIPVYEDVEMLDRPSRPTMDTDIAPEVPVIKQEPQETKLVTQSPPLCRPNKCPRLIFDGVLLPTLALVHTRRKEEKEDYKKLKLLKNPKAKIDEDMVFLPRTLTDRLKPIGLEPQTQYITLDKITQEATVSRLFMAKVYGGNMQETKPKVAAKFVAIHGMNDFMYINKDFQPVAAITPCAPGLFLGTEPGPDYGKVMRVISKLSNNEWVYIGMYEVKAANPPFLTVKEWSEQDPKFHTKWAHKMSRKAWGAKPRARILGRKEFGREPTEREVEKIIANERHKTITADEIKAAYLQGKERMGVWSMKCVGYDNDFQRQLSERFPAWIPPPPRPKKQSKVGKKSTKVGNSTSRGQKRKRSESPDSDMESEDSDDDDSEA